MFEPLARKQRQCQRPQCFFVGGLPPFFSPPDLPIGGTVSVPVVAIVALVPDVPEVSVAVVLVFDGVGDVPVVSVELVVVVVPVVLEVTPVSVTAVSVLAFSSFLQAPRRASRARRTKNFLINGTPLTWVGM